MHYNQRHKKSPSSEGLVSSPGICFITYAINCFYKEDPEEELMSLELSPLSILIASASIRERTNESSEQSYALAVVDVMDKLMEDYTILEIKQK